MKHPLRRLSIVLIIIIFIAGGCFTYNQISRNNVAYLYSETGIIMQPEYLLYHFTADSSTLYFKINTEELLYARDGFMSNFMAKYDIKYELLLNYDSRQIVDSASRHYNDTVLTTKSSFITDSLNIKIPYGNNYVLKITVTDLNRTQHFISYLNVYKGNDRSNQSFMIRDEENMPVFEKYLERNQKICITYPKDSLNRLFVKYYKNKFPIATPPFHVQSGKPTTIYPDSIYDITLKNKVSDFFSLKGEGVYRIMTDTTQKECLTLMRFYEDFPAITLSEQMIYSVRYLTTREEFDKMIIMADKKAAIDNFWIEIGGNSDRARQLIKSYYGRVQQANKYFTSYHEGWKTDRGMIYIIYGPPTSVYKSSETENWIYGEPTNLKSINFMFYKVENPFTENDYMMSKSELFRDSWYYAVSNWRR